MKVKKLLTIIAALALPLAAHATYYNYNPTEVQSFSIKDSSYGSTYEYTIDIEQRGKNGSWYPSTATIYLTPKTHSFVGEFSVADGTLSADSYVYYNGATRYFIESDNYWSTDNRTTLSITANADGTYTFGGTIVCKNGSNYYRYLFTDYIYDPFASEPARGTVSVTAEDIRAYNFIATQGYVELDLNSTDGPYAVLGFKSSTFYIPAGTYSLDASGNTGTFIASTGMDGYYAIPSYVETLGYPATDYFLRSGTITVSYANGNMTVSGTATSAHGSSVTISATGTSPFEEPTPPQVDTVRLDVSAVKLTPGENCFELDITARNGEDPCNGYVRINSSTITGNFDYTTFYSWCKFGSIYMDTFSTANRASIAATSNTDEYRLDLAMMCEDGKCYKIENAVFTYKAPAPPTPYDSEPAKGSDISFTTNASATLVDRIAQDGYLVVEYFNGNADVLDLAFVTDNAKDIPAGTYAISDSGAPGTIKASAGYVDDIFTPSVLGVAASLFDTDHYFLRSGSVTVSYSGYNIVIKGSALSYNGTRVDIDITGPDPFGHKALPDNMLAGYLGAGVNYVIAHDITTNADRTVTVAATIMPDSQMSGFQPYVSIAGSESAMSCDAATGACEFTTSATFTKGTAVDIVFRLAYTGGSATTATVKYVVE